MRRLLAAVSGLVVGALTILPGAGAAQAAPILPADLQVSASGASGHIGGSVEVRLVLRNYGPNPLVAETFQLVITAPPGTRLAGGSALAGSCQQDDHEARCRYGFGLRRGDRHELKLGLRIESQPSGCGRVASEYSQDPRDRNNAANIRVTVGGQPRSCDVRGEQSPTPKASPSSEATPEAGSVTEAPPDDASASAEVLPAAPSDDSTGGMSLAGFLVIGGGLALVALGGMLIWRLMRREPDEDYDEDEDDRGYQPPNAYPPTTYQPNPGWNTGTAPYGGGETTQWNPGGPGRHAQPPGHYPPEDTGPIYGR